MVGTKAPLHCQGDPSSPELPSFHVGLLSPSDSDLPLTRPWQPVLGSSLLGDLPTTCTALLLKGINPHLLLFLLLLKNRSRKYIHCSLVAKRLRAVKGQELGRRDPSRNAVPGVRRSQTGAQEAEENWGEEQEGAGSRGAGTPAQRYPHEFLHSTPLHLEAHLSSQASTRSGAHSGIDGFPTLAVCAVDAARVAGHGGNVI